MPPEVHPGEIIEMDIMEPRGLDLEAAALSFSISPEMLAGVIAGHCADAVGVTEGS